MARPLPDPDPAFRWTAAAWGPVLTCAPLDAIARHVFTTRHLPLRTSPDAWRDVAAAVGVVPERIARVTQVHGAAVRAIRRGEAGGVDAARPEADALATNEPGLALAVQMADCAPILLADPRTGAVAAVHAGWRGVAARITWAAVEALQREFGVDPEDLVAAVGPAIGPCCYEVGEDLLDAFRAADTPARNLDRWFSWVRVDGGRGSLRLDVPRAVREQLIAAGLRPARVHVAGLCTRTHRDVFDSYRADGPAAGRMAAVIVTPAVVGRVSSQ
ncbi:MAG: peptidoglycan editing factor PgeF [Acidobacteriota bacterium]